MRLAVLGWATLIVGLLAGCAAPRAAEPPISKLDLQRMIDSVDDGATVRILAGRYIIEKGISISGRHDLTLQMDRDAQILLTDVEQNVLTITKSKDIQVQGGVLRHLKPLKEYQCHGSVVAVEDSSAVAISNADLNGCGAVGVHAIRVGGLKIEHCWIHENTFNALYLDGCSKVVIHANVIERNANTFQLLRCDDVESHDNLERTNGGYWQKAEPPGILRTGKR